MIGIVGGTFDPVHYGHLRPVHHVARQLEFRKTHYVLSARPPHRALPIASAYHRYEMLRLALREFPQFIADDQEMRRPGPSYTVWTLRDMRQHYGDESVCLVLGMDAYLGLQGWYRWQEIMLLVNIAVLLRPGWNPPDGTGFVSKQEFSRQSAGAVWISDASEVPVTATALRQRLGAGEDTGDEIPTAVFEYIQQNNIYGVNRV